MKGLPHKAVAGMPATTRQSNREGKQTMKKKIQALLAVAVVGVLAMGLAGCSSGGNDEGNKGNASGDTANLRFVTGGESGTYYAYGNVLAQYATNGEYGLGVTALSGNGSQANVQALQDDDADVAFCQSDVLAYAYEGTNLFEEDGAYKDFSVVASLYQEQVQIVTCNPDIKSVADLKGKTVSVGAAGSGVYFNAIDVLAAYDMTLEDITPVYQSLRRFRRLPEGREDRRGLHRGRRPHHGHHRPVHHQDRLPGFHGPGPRGQAAEGFSLLCRSHHLRRHVRP